MDDNVVKRFENFIMPEPMSGCWLWNGALSGAGYGQMGVNGKIEYAHRISYIIHNGEIPSGMVVRHTCDNPACANPHHLIIGTMKDNCDDMFRRGRNRHVALKGEDNRAAILTESKVKRIMKMYGKGIMIVSIASKYGVTASAVSNVIRGISWNHVTGLKNRRLKNNRIYQNIQA